jgi:thiol:disulfide interchange protein
MNMRTLCKSSFALMVVAATLLQGCNREKNTPVAADVPVAKPAAFIPKHEGMQPDVVTKPPAVKQHLYDDDANPAKLVAAGLKEAKAEHKHLILDFGGDWCGDCQVLDLYMHEPVNEDLLEKNFVVVHVSVGHMDKNLDVAEKYGVDISHGVPALAVLDSNGKVLYAQATGEFEAMRKMYSSSVTEFLNKWKV